MEKGLDWDGAGERRELRRSGVDIEFLRLWRALAGRRKFELGTVGPVL